MAEGSAQNPKPSWSNRLATLAVGTAAFMNASIHNPTEVEKPVATIQIDPEQDEELYLLQFRVNKMIDEVLPKLETTEDKKAALDAINKVLETSIEFKDWFNSKGYNEGIVKYILLDQIIRKYPDAEDPLGSFLEAVQKPEMGLREGHPLADYRSLNFLPREAQDAAPIEFWEENPYKDQLEGPIENKPRLFMPAPEAKPMPPQALPSGIIAKPLEQGVASEISHRGRK